MNTNQFNPNSETDARMVQAYKYIAKQLAAFSKQMLNKIGIIQNGGGIINDGEIADTLNELANMINSCLYNVSDSRVSITMKPITKGSNSDSPTDTNKQTSNKINESQLKAIVAESVRKVLKETVDTPYGKMSTNPLKPTFDDTNTQNRLKFDVTSMLSKLSTQRFMKYWNMRLLYDDPDMVDAIYHEYYERYKRGEI